MNTNSPIELTPSRRVYDPTLFVARNKELQLIETRVQTAQIKRNITDPLINFWGVRNLGKTWLLCHVANHYSHSKEDKLKYKELGLLPTFSLFYSFPDEPATLSLEDMTIKLANEALSQLSSALTPEEKQSITRALNENSITSLTKSLEKLSQRFVPVILLDNADKVSQTDWKKLERIFIEPLVITGRVLIVVAGRRQVPRWHRFEVRRRVMDPEKSQVLPFDKQAIIQQLDKLGYHIPLNLLFPYTVGNPHLADVIAQHAIHWKREIIKDTEFDEAWLNQHRSNLHRILKASETEMLEEISLEFVNILNAVSPLRFYRLEALRFMLIHKDSKYEEQPDGYYLNMLLTLDQNTEMVWWDREHRAYVTSEVIRRLINRRQLLEEDNSFYVSQHQRALDMYQELVHEYPQASEDFILEIWFHLVSLYLANQNTDDLLSKAKEALQIACNSLNSDRFLVLQKQFEGDHELIDLLPREVSKKLKQELTKILNHKAQ